MKNIILAVILVGSSLTTQAQTYNELITTTKASIMTALKEGKAQDAATLAQALVQLQTGQMLDVYGTIIEDFKPQIQSLGKGIKMLAAYSDKGTNTTDGVLAEWLLANTREDAEKAIAKWPAARKAETEAWTTETKKFEEERKKLEEGRKTPPAPLRK